MNSLGTFLILTILVFLVNNVLGQYSYSNTIPGSSSSSSSSYSYRSSSSGSSPLASSGSSSSSSNLFSSLLSPSLKRYECMNTLPSKGNVVPNGGVVFSGSVVEIKPDMDDDNQNGQYSVLVLVKRVFAGPQSLRKSLVTVAGFGDQPQPRNPSSSPSSHQWCHTNVKRGDSWVFVVQQIAPDYFRLNGSLVKINLKNLQTLEGILNDEPFRKVTKVTDLPCEKKYCENNGYCVPDSSSLDGTRCECLTSCPQSYSPVCGSNGETYSNECELRLRSCLAKQNVFVKSLSKCPIISQYSSVQESSYRSGYAPPSASPSRPTSYSRTQDLASPSGRDSPGSSSSSTYTTSYRTNYYDRKPLTSGDNGGSYSVSRSSTDNSPGSSTSYSYSRTREVIPGPSETVVIRQQGREPLPPYTSSSYSSRYSNSYGSGDREPAGSSIPSRAY